MYLLTFFSFVQHSSLDNWGPQQLQASAETCKAEAHKLYRSLQGVLNFDVSE